MSYVQWLTNEYNLYSRLSPNNIIFHSLIIGYLFSLTRQAINYNGRYIASKQRN